MKRNGFSIFNRNEKGFTIVELMVGLIIAAVISGGTGAATIQTLHTAEATDASNSYVYSVGTQARDDAQNHPLTQWGYNNNSQNGTAIPVPVVNANVTAIGTTSATLNGNLTSLGAYSPVNCSFNWGTTNAYGSTTAKQQLTTTGNFSSTLTGLTSGTTYHIRASVEHGSVVSYSGDVSFATLTPPNTPPSVNTIVTATNITSNSTTLNGYLNSLGSATSVQCSFDWGLTMSYGNNALVTSNLTAPGNFTVNLTGLTQSTMYYFRAKATSVGGTAYSNSNYFTTGSPIYSIYGYAIIALNGPISLTGNAAVTSDPASPAAGDIYANGNIRLTGNVAIHNGTATGTISRTGNISNATLIQNLSPALSFAVPDTASLYAQANAGGNQTSVSLSGNNHMTLGPTHIKGNLSLTGNSYVQLGGTVWVDGTISLTGNNYIQGPGTLVAQGNIKMTGNSELQPNAIPLVVSTNGAITITGNSATSAIIYAPVGAVSITGNGYVYGSVVGQSVSNTGNAGVKYPTAIRSRG